MIEQYWKSRLHADYSLPTNHSDALISSVVSLSLLSSWSQRYGALYHLERALIKGFKLTFGPPLLLERAKLPGETCFYDLARAGEVICFAHRLISHASGGGHHYRPAVYVEQGVVRTAAGQVLLYTARHGDCGYDWAAREAAAKAGVPYCRHKVTMTAASLVARLAAEQTWKPQPDLLSLGLYRREHLLLYMAQIPLSDLLRPRCAQSAYPLYDSPEQAAP